MAEQNPEVMELVRRELERDPGASTTSLRERAMEIDPSVGELSARQFHARYPLQVKRAQSGGAAGRGKGAADRKRAGRKRGGGRAPAAEAAPGGTAPAGGAASRPRARRAAAAGADPSEREAVRRVLLEFASDFAEAETRSEIVRVLNGVDAYVERIARITGGASRP